MPPVPPFRRPSTAQIEAAFGGSDIFSRMVRAGMAQPIPSPGVNDWLRNHEEKGQTFKEFQAKSPMMGQDPIDTIILQPIGDYSDDPSLAPPLSLLAEYINAFFNVKVVILKCAPLTNIPNLTTRDNDGVRQLLIQDIYGYLSERRKRFVLTKKCPRTTTAILGVTMEDLYPSEQWNYVFGQARIGEGLGVFSFARFRPSFPFQESMEEDAEVILYRSCKVLSHEIGHIFGIRHCIYLRCLMNGANHLGEMDAQSLHLCPLCLKKLKSLCKWDLMARSQALEAFYLEHPRFDDAALYEQQLQQFLTSQLSGLGAGAAHRPSARRPPKAKEAAADATLSSKP